MRQRNAQFATAAKSGRNPTNPSRKEQLARKPPIPMWVIGIIAFALIGGGRLSIFHLFGDFLSTLLAFFEIARLFF
jgi:hypothetical protein